MIRRGSRAQASFEYIAIYGWATLIILGSLGVLYSFDLLNFNSFAQDKCLFYGQAECVEAQVISDPSSDYGNITFVLQNDFGTDLVVKNFSIDDRYFNCDSKTNLHSNWGANENMQLSTNCGAGIGTGQNDFVSDSRTESTITVYYYRNITICNNGNNEDCNLRLTGVIEQTIQEPYN